VKGALWVVRHLAPPEWCESIAGDLEEDRRRRLAEGRSAGEVWAVTAALGAVIELQIESFRGG
jgi:hypothetical protein